jgi:isopentenyl-diphosphate delta-isomerase
METERRKLEHIMISLQKPVQHDKPNGFEHVKLRPGGPIDPEEVDVSTAFLGKKFSAPLLIEAMTGGAPGTGRINLNLAEAAERLGIGMGVGSQRAAMENPRVLHTFKLRHAAPKMFLLGNLGIAQVVAYPMEKIREAVESIGADALAVHINPVHEAVQPEGDRGTGRLTKKLLEKIREIKSQTRLKVVAKEVGFGIRAELARRLEEAGVDAIDVAGAGGTSWVKIEHYRGSKNASKFFGEGIPTAETLLQCSSAVRVPLISSGGIRTGEEIAKSIAMGATLAGAAMPFLKPALESPESVMAVAERMTDELKRVMAGVGARKPHDLRGRYTIMQ